MTDSSSDHFTGKAIPEFERHVLQYQRIYVVLILAALVLAVLA